MTQSQKGVKTLKKNICKGLLLVMLVAALAGCNGDTKQQDPVMQSVSTTAPTAGSLTTVPTTVPTVSTTPAPTAGTVTVPSPQSTTAPTTAPPSLPSSGVTTAPSTDPTTVPTTVTTQPGHVCTFTSTEVDATCTTGSYILWKCACGKTVQDFTSNPLGHKYGEWISNNDATCVKDGTKTRKCERCGNPESKPDAGSHEAVEHKWKQANYYSATPCIEGYSSHQCSVCGGWERFNFTPILTGNAADEWYKEAEAATLKYLNQYRAEIGSPELTMLPGLSEVMRYRAFQLQENQFTNPHDPEEWKVAFGEYKYGEYKDMVELNTLFPELGFNYTEADNYYGITGQEATAWLGKRTDPDTLGFDIATGFKMSGPHWSYLQLASYAYVGIGIECDPVFGTTVSIWVTNDNYG